VTRRKRTTEQEVMFAWRVRALKHLRTLLKLFDPKSHASGDAQWAIRDATAFVVESEPVDIPVKVPNGHSNGAHE